MTNKIFTKLMWFQSKFVPTMVNENYLVALEYPNSAGSTI